METNKIFTSKSTMPQNVLSPSKPDLLKMKKKNLDEQSKPSGTDIRFDRLEILYTFVVEPFSTRLML